MKRRPPNNPKLIHPPEIGSRLSAQDFANALANAGTDPDAAALVRDDTTKALRKRQFIANKPGVLYDDQGRDKSASGTVVAGMTSWEAADRYRIKRSQQPRGAAKLSRSEPLKQEIARVLKLNPQAQAKEVLRELRKRAGVAGSLIISASNRGVQWPDKGGKLQTTGLAGIQKQLSKRKGKPGA